MYNMIESGNQILEYTVESKLLATVPKLPAILSILCSCAIITKVAHKSANNRLVFDRIMLGLSITDIVISINYFLGTWLIPKGTIGAFGPVYGAVGNDATCKMSGFLGQYSVASTMYNASLAQYFLLTIYYSWRERDLEKVEKWFHIVPISFAIFTSTFALASDLYENVEWLCWINPEPKETPIQKSFKLIQWLFLFGPVWICLFFQSAVMYILFRKIREFEKSMSKYSFQSVRETFKAKQKHQPASMTSRKTQHVDVTKRNSPKFDAHIQDEVNQVEIKSSIENETNDVNKDIAIQQYTVEFDTTSSVNDMKQRDRTDSLESFCGKETKRLGDDESMEDNAEKQSPSKLRFSDDIIVRTISAEIIDHNERTKADNKASTKISKALRSMVQSLSTSVSSTMFGRTSVKSLQSSEERKRIYKQYEKSRLIATQGILYVCAFYVTWLFPTISRITGFFGKQYYVIQILDSTLLPMQGLFNFIIYIRPRYVAYRQENAETGRWRSLHTVITSTQNSN